MYRDDTRAVFALLRPRATDHFEKPWTRPLRLRNDACQAPSTVHLSSARLTKSSYTVQAKAELIAFRAILKTKPSKRLFRPSSFSINFTACTIFRYLRGCNCSRVFTASGGFVTAVAKDAASVLEAKLMPADVLAFILGASE